MQSRLLLVALTSFSLSMPLWADSTATDQNHTTQAQKSPAQRRADIDKAVQQSLAQVYKKYPKAKEQIAKAAGYAVFKSGGFTAVFLGAGGGEGAAISHGKKTYMTMVQGKVGLGLGAKETREVLVFTDPAAFERFISSGWAADANATAAAKVGDSGGAIAGAKPVAHGVYAYQFTENGLVAEATIAGSKYSVNKELNMK